MAVNCRSDLGQEVAWKLVHLEPGLGHLKLVLALSGPFCSREGADNYQEHVCAGRPVFDRRRVPLVVNEASVTTGSS